MNERTKARIIGLFRGLLFSIGGVAGTYFYHLVYDEPVNWIILTTSVAFGVLIGGYGLLFPDNLVRAREQPERYKRDQTVARLLLGGTLLASVIILLVVFGVVLFFNYLFT